MNNHNVTTAGRSSCKIISPNRTVVTSFASVQASSAAATSTSTSTSTNSNNGYSYDDGHYVLHIARSQPISPASSQQLVSCALSDGTIHTYDRETLKKVHTIECAHGNSSSSSSITDLSYTHIATGNSTSPMILSSGMNGTVKLFDLRCNGNANGSTNGNANANNRRPDGSAAAALEMVLPDGHGEALSVSVGYNGALAAVGGKKGNIHFFDLRSVSSNSNSGGTGSTTTSEATKPLGTYVDAHTEEVTRVRFQNVPASSSNVNGYGHGHGNGYETTSLLVSAGEDGLACIHDTSQPSEESALRSILNVQSPLRDVGFFGPSLEGLYCLTGSETMSVWHHDSAQRMCDYGDVNLRNMLSSQLSQVDTGNGIIGNGNNSGMDVNYLVGCHWDGTELNLVAGNNEGECAIFRVEANSISPKVVLRGGHKSCIRAFTAEMGGIITGGEDSRLCEWDLNSNPNGSMNSNHSSMQGVVSTNANSNVPSYSLSSQTTMPRAGGGRIRRQKNRKGHTPY
mmetsp:Transcript_17249/g.25770  ORF Transcript_17249/g.25770 Transcript_17249/m.25770 type:complete len:512 (+) Transcript_17249:464-1999(+)